MFYITRNLLRFVALLPIALVALLALLIASAFVFLHFKAIVLRAFIS